MARKNTQNLEIVTDFTSWSAKDYLNDYYSFVEQDEMATLKFLVQEFRKIKGDPVALEFGSGPTLHHLLPLAPYVSEIHVCDYVDNNLEEVRKWVFKQKGAHDWKPFTRQILIYEGIENPTDDDIEIREDMTRQKITKFFNCDASKPQPIGSEAKYDVLLTCYCADSATSSREIWENYMKNILSLLGKGGFLVTAALRKCKFYKVGSLLYPCASLTELDFLNLFKRLDFKMETVRIIVEDVPEHKDIGYESIILASGFKSDEVKS